MPGRSGLELIKDLKAQYPDLPVLVLSIHDETFYAERVLRAGARGESFEREHADAKLAGLCAEHAFDLHLAADQGLQVGEGVEDAHAGERGGSCRAAKVT